MQMHNGVTLSHKATEIKNRSNSCAVATKALNLRGAKPPTSSSTRRMRHVGSAARGSCASSRPRTPRRV